MAATSSCDDPSSTTNTRHTSAQRLALLLLLLLPLPPLLLLLLDTARWALPPGWYKSPSWASSDPAVALKSDSRRHVVMPTVIRQHP
jgi:hypothetical protein